MYTSWSVVFGEQPSAAKWNILGTNDASFNDGTGIADAAITPAKIAVGTIVETNSSTQRTVSSPLGSLSETIELTAGTWEIWFNCLYSLTSTSNLIQGARVGLSTSTSAFSHDALVAELTVATDTGGSTNKTRQGTLSARDIVTLASTTTFTLIGVRTGSNDGLIIAGTLPTVLKARKLSDETS